MIVFDTEPFVALYNDEPGSDRVEARITDIEQDDERGTINAVTCTEIHYLIRDANRDHADEFVSRIRTQFDVIEADTVWNTASYFKHEHRVSLGDAFTLATAASHDATAFVGADDDFEAVSEVSVDRFRTVAA